MYFLSFLQTLPSRSSFSDKHTGWKVPKCGVFSGPYFVLSGLISVFSPNMGKYGREKPPYSDTFHAVTRLHYVKDKKNTFQVFLLPTFSILWNWRFQLLHFILIDILNFHFSSTYNWYNWITKNWDSMSIILQKWTVKKF